MTPAARTSLLLIGSNPGIDYLLKRYAERNGQRIYAVDTLPSVTEVLALQPMAIFFPSIDNLEAAQSLVGELANADIPLLVCSSVADQVQARDLGADYCLMHPLTYDSFVAALTATHPASGGRPITRTRRPDDR